MTIIPMQPEYHLAIAQLLVDSFGKKLHRFTRLSTERLTQFFAHLLSSLPEDSTGLRMVAIHNGAVMGTIALKWKKGIHDFNTKTSLSFWRHFRAFGRLNVIKLMLGLYFLDHTPTENECYIADVCVHPDHRSKGIGQQLLCWAKDYTKAHVHFNRLSLHVSAQNGRAKKLYEQVFFQTQSEMKSTIRYLLFREYKWNYMVYESYGLKGYPS